MSRWLRILITLVRARFRETVRPEEETSLVFRVWPTDVDLAFMNNAALLAIAELGRIDFMSRSGFLRYARKNGLYFPLASIYVRFVRPLRRFQKAQLRSQLIHWDRQWIYLRHTIMRAEKPIALVLAKAAIKKGRDRVPLDSIIQDLGWDIGPERRIELIELFEATERLIGESLLKIEPSGIEPESRQDGTGGQGEPALERAS